MVGLDFKIGNEYNNYLYKIFSSIDLSKYLWEIVTDDIICNENKNEGLFSSRYIDGKNFMNEISKSNYYLIFANLKAFPINAKPKRIENFNDFWESDCQMILLCVDSEFINFYCKDKVLLESVYRNCKKNGFKSIEFVTFEDASHRSMIAF